jgi:hypothetical protein
MSILLRRGVSGSSIIQMPDDDVHMGNDQR